MSARAALGDTRAGRSANIARADRCECPGVSEQRGSIASGRRSTIVLAALIWALIASGCAGGIPGSSAPKPTVAAESSAGDRPFVYRTRSELVLATAQRVIARHSGNYIDLGFTHDDSHVYAVDDTGELTAIAVPGGIGLPHRVPCRCERVFPLHDAVVGWWEGPDHFVQADLRSPNPTVRTPVSLPPPVPPIAPGNTLSSPRLLAADGRTLILGRVEAPPRVAWGINHLTAVEVATGTARPLGRVDEINTAIGTAALRPDGGELVLGGYVRDGNSCGTARLVRIELAQGRLEILYPPALTGCSELVDLRWAEMVPTATGLFWQPNSPDRLLATAVWTAPGARWDRHGGDDTIRHAALAPAVTLEIRRVAPGRVHAVHSGDLLLFADSEMRVLDHEVVDLRLPRARPEPLGPRMPPGLRKAGETCDRWLRCVP
ncbi:hypothetical protein [Nocardia wallacei]|uniref:hypothetical protein n=1 Tax=Nocardia wallacei TaxID=480035 RepID=UPI0024539674|nr:hypothetical protein [Nocardia wallacei]